MWPFSSSKPIDIVEPTPILAPVPIKIPTAEEWKEYVTLAGKLGISIGEIEAFFADSGITRYDYDVVKRYLDAKFGEEYRRDGLSCATWCWRPLRTKDFDTFRSTLTMRTNGGLSGNVYDKPVPYEALLTVDKIVEKFPAAVFFVSDETNANDFRDPFLAVLFPAHSALTVVERWDEPGFRMEPRR